MKRRVKITGPAERDVLANHDWWAKNRSSEQANRWLEGVYATMWRLGETADRHAVATERALRTTGVRQASFGLGRRPSHRILFAIEGEEVIVYRVRALKQDAVALDDLD